MDILTIDSIIDITIYLNDKDKIKFLSSSKELHILKDKVHYNDQIYIGDINDLWYFDRFTNIHISNSNYRYPIPNSIIKLSLRYYFYADIKGYIPNTVTHLTFGGYFNQNIEGCIPTSVTHLTFGHYFNKKIKGHI